MKKILFCLALASFAACTPSNSQTPTPKTTSQRDPLPQLNRATAALLSSNQTFAHSISQAPTKNKTYTQIADVAHQINYLSAKFCKDANPDVNPAAAYSELATNIEKQLKAVSSDVSLDFYTIRQDQADALFKKSTFGGQRPELLSDADFQKLSAQERTTYTAQLQADAAAGTNELLSFIGEKVEANDIKLTQLTILSFPKKSAILLGETFETDITLGAYSSNIPMSVSVNGAALVVKDGVAHYAAKPNAVGEQHCKAVIRVSNPMTGEPISFVKEFDYEVVVPSAVVSAEGANILYLNQENKVTIAVAGVAAGNLGVSVEGADIVSKTGTIYIVRPTKLGAVTIKVTNKALDRTIGNFSFEVKSK